MCCCDERRRRRRRGNPVKGGKAQTVLAPHMPAIPNWAVNSIRQKQQTARNESLANAIALGPQTETKKKSKALPIAIGAIGVGAAVFFLTR